jgi:hypothetical protein
VKMVIDGPSDLMVEAVQKTIRFYRAGLMKSGVVSTILTDPHIHHFKFEIRMVEEGYIRVEITAR